MKKYAAMALMTPVTSGLRSEVISSNWYTNFKHHWVREQVCIIYESHYFVEALGPFIIMGWFYVSINSVSFQYYKLPIDDKTKDPSITAHYIKLHGIIS